MKREFKWLLIVHAVRLINVEETRDVNTSFVHGVPHKFRVVYHADAVLTNGMAVKVDDTHSLNYGVPLLVISNSIQCLEHHFYLKSEFAAAGNLNS